MGKRKRNNGEEQQNRVPRGILPQLYADNPRLCTLYDLLITLLLPSLQDRHASAPETSVLGEHRASAAMTPLEAALPENDAITAAHALLVRDGDSDDYLFLLHYGYGVLSDTAPTIGNTTLEQRWTHQQVIERAIQILFKQGKQSTNVLCFGFQQPKPRSLPGREKIGLAGLSCVHDNAAVRVLNSQPWRALHTRVGDLILLHLVLYADLFHPLPQKCFIQVAGTSSLLAARAQILGDWHGLMQKPRDTKHTCSKKRRVSQVDAEESREIIRPAGFDVHLGIGSGHYESNPSIHRNVLDCSRKRRRPYSWQRRKSQKAGAGQSDQKSALTKLHNPRAVASPSCHPSLLDCGEYGPATQAEMLKVSTNYGASSEALPGTHEEHSVLSFRSTKEMKSGRLNIPVVDFLSQPKSVSYVSARVEEEGKQKDRRTKLSSSYGQVQNFTEALFCAQEGHVTEKAEDCRRSCGAVGNLGSTGLAKRLINRTKMFYKAKFPQHAGLPMNHILRRLRSTDKAVAMLFADIFGQQSLRGASQLVPCSKKSCKCIHSLLKKIISNARCCQYARLLKRHCPPCGINMPGARERDTSSDSRSIKQDACKGVDGSEKGEAEERNNGFSSHTQVVAFIWAVCRSIIPEEILGSKRNWRNLRRNIFSFVSLRRHETFSLQQCMFKLRLSGYTWWLDHGCNCSKEAPDGGYRKGLLEKWIYWLFTELIVPLIQAHFYVTESEMYRQNVLFYRKSVWAKMQANVVMEMKKSNFKKLSAESTVNIVKQGSLGVSRARLLPKKMGMRLIANLGGSSVISAGCARKEKGKSVEMAKNQVSTIICKQKPNCTRIAKSSKKRERSCGPIATRQDVNSNQMKSSTVNFKPVNLVLKDAYLCLKYEQEAHGQDLGCSVFDYNDVYRKLLPYIISLKQQADDASHVFLVVCDVSQAFDSIKQEKLIEILHEFIREKEYSVRRYGYASSSAKSLKVFHERAAMPVNKNTSLMDFFLQKALKQQNAVCIDQAYATTVKQSHIIQLLKEHILRNILQIGKHNYLQVVGIPQGSILSSLLCSLYYGHLERCRLASLSGLGHINPKIEKKGSSEKKMAFLAIKADTATPLFKSHSDDRSVQQAGRSWNILLRLVDDWLFISTSQEDALEFVKKAHRGFTDYNCMANRRKTAVSFIADIGGSHLNMNVYRTKDGACFIRWSGLLINCNTLEIQADYTRYCEVDLRSTLTVWRKENYGCHLMAKLCTFMRPKCHPIFYDANINSPATVFLNAYQAFLLCAMKFHAYNRSLPYDGKCNPIFGFKAVQKAARYMHSLLVYRTSKISKSSVIKPLLLLHANETCWLAFRAFQTVLLRKQSRYARLLALVEKELGSGKYEGFSVMPSMISALDASRSSMFEDIVY